MVVVLVAVVVGSGRDEIENKKIIINNNILMKW